MAATATAATRHVFVTGQPGVGKSTLIAAVLSRLQHTGRGSSSSSGGAAPAALPRASIQGFYTAETRGGGADSARTGFDVVTWEPEACGGGSRRGPLARVGPATRGAPTVGKYAVDLPSFEALALPVLSLKHSPAPRLVVIDEVGKMELCCPAFFPAVETLLDAGPVVFGSVPVTRHGRTIPEVDRITSRPDVCIVSVTKANRNTLVGEVAALLTSLLSKADL